MKDYLGNKLEVGDEVIYITPGYRDFTKGVITRFTKFYVFIKQERETRGGTINPYTIKQTPSQLIKIIK